MKRALWSFSFFCFTRGLRYRSWGLSKRISGVSGRRKSEARQQTLTNFFRKKIFSRERKESSTGCFQLQGSQRTERGGAFGMDGARFGEGGGWRWEETQQDKMQEMRLL